MSNVAAELLLERLGDDAMGEDRRLIERALAAERRATVERIRRAVGDTPDEEWHCNCNPDYQSIMAILDEASK